MSTSMLSAIAGGAAAALLVPRPKDGAPGAPGAPGPTYVPPSGTVRHVALITPSYTVTGDAMVREIMFVAPDPGVFVFMLNWKFGAGAAAGDYIDFVRVNGLGVEESWQVTPANIFPMQALGIACQKGEVVRLRINVHIAATATVYLGVDGFFSKA